MQEKMCRQYLEIITNQQIDMIKVKRNKKFILLVESRQSITGLRNGHVTALSVITPQNVWHLRWKFALNAIIKFQRLSKRKKEKKTFAPKVR